MGLTVSVYAVGMHAIISIHFAHDLANRETYGSILNWE